MKLSSRVPLLCGYSCLTQTVARSPSSLSCQSCVSLTVCSSCTESLVTQNHSCIFFYKSHFCVTELKYDYRDWLRGERMPGNDYMWVSNIFRSINRIRPDSLAQKAIKIDQIGYIAAQQETNFLVLSCEKAVSQMVKWSCVATLASSDADINTVLFSNLQINYGTRCRLVSKERNLAVFKEHCCFLKTWHSSDYNSELPYDKLSIFDFSSVHMEL